MLPTQAKKGFEISQKLRQKSQHGTITTGVVARLMFAHYENELPSVLQTKWSTVSATRFGSQKSAIPQHRD